MSASLVWSRALGGDYDFHRYFLMEGEGILYHVMMKLLRKPHSLKRETLTVGMLHRALIDGRWDSKALSQRQLHGGTWNSAGSPGAHRRAVATATYDPLRSVVRSRSLRRFLKYCGHPTAGLFGQASANAVNYLAEPYRLGVHRVPSHSI